MTLADCETLKGYLAKPFPCKIQRKTKKNQRRTKKNSQKNMFCFSFLIIFLWFDPRWPIHSCGCPRCTGDAMPPWLAGSAAQLGATSHYTICSMRARISTAVGEKRISSLNVCIAYLYRISLFHIFIAYFYSISLYRISLLRNFIDAKEWTKTLCFSSNSIKK